MLAPGRIQNNHPYHLSFRTPALSAEESAFRGSETTDSLRDKNRATERSFLGITTMRSLALGFGLQLHIAVRDVDGKLHGLAAVLFADLVGLFLHETAETVQVPDALPGF